MSNLCKLTIKTRRDWGKGGTALLVFSYPEPSVSLARRLIARRETREFEEIDFFYWMPRNRLHYFYRRNPAVIKFQFPSSPTCDQDTSHATVTRDLQVIYVNLHTHCRRLFTLSYFSVGFSRLVRFDLTHAILACKSARNLGRVSKLYYRGGGVELGRVR